MINGNEIDAEKDVQTFGVLETKHSAKVFLKLLICIYLTSIRRQDSNSNTSSQFT